MLNLKYLKSHFILFPENVLPHARTFRQVLHKILPPPFIHLQYFVSSIHWLYVHPTSAFMQLLGFHPSPHDFHPSTWFSSVTWLSSLQMVFICPLGFVHSINFIRPLAFIHVHLISPVLYYSFSTASSFSICPPGLYLSTWLSFINMALHPLDRSSALFCNLTPIAFSKPAEQ